MVKIGLVMGSNSDWGIMKEAALILEEFSIPYEKRVISAHRTPDLLFSYGEEAAGRGLQAIIAGAGGAAHLPGMLAAKTLIPVLGVPIPATELNGVDALYSIVQMPKGVPVATFAIGKAGAVNAALFAISQLALSNQTLYQALAERRKHAEEKVLAMELD